MSKAIKFLQCTYFSKNEELKNSRMQNTSLHLR